jgi:hypothetical protein
VGINNVTFSKKFYSEFFKIIIGIATPDLFYKIPEKFITSEMVDQIPEYSEIKPKFYRKAFDITKSFLLEKLVRKLKLEGFPEPKLSPERISYLLKLVTLNPNCNKAWISLWEISNPSVYESARELWTSEGILKKVAFKLLTDYRVITNKTIREVVRHIIGIPMEFDKDTVAAHFLISV